MKTNLDEVKVLESKHHDLQQLADDLNTDKIKLEEIITDLKRELFKSEEELSNFLNTQKNEHAELLQKIETMKNESLGLKVQKEELEKQVSSLLLKISEYSQVIENQLIDKNNLEKEANSVNLAKVLAGTLENKKSVKLKINELLKEIDRCIANLKAQS